MYKYFNTLLIASVFIGILSFSSCNDDDEKEKVPARFEYIDDKDGYDNNHPHFYSTSSTSNENLTLIYSWNFSNGEYSSDSAFTPTYDFPGDYIVQFTVTTSEGVSDYDTMTYTVTNVNPDLIQNKYLNNLCINVTNNDSTDTKEWVLSSKYGHISTGPSAAINNGQTADFLNDPIVETRFYGENYFTDTLGLETAYDNKMSFTLEQYIYKNTDTTNNLWLTNWYFANSEFGYSQEIDQDICIDVTTGIDTAGYFRLNENDDGTIFLEVSGKNFMLYYEGKPSKTQYQVLALYDDLMVVRKLYFNENGLPAGYRYLRFVPANNQHSDILKEISIIDPPME